MIKIMKYNEISNEEIFSRSIPTVNVADIVSEIICTVRDRKDAALFDYVKKFDHVELDQIEVTSNEIDEAFQSIDSKFRSVIEEAAENIRSFHSRQIRSGFIINEKQGIILGQKVIPLDRVGLYVPGGTASYPSSVLMNAIPAKLAGVREIIMVTPPGKDGKVPSAILAAAKIAGVDRIFKVGGAQAVAALAYGTETIPPVDKIVGPGNAFVAEAKKQVFGAVAIDMIAGPSEILIISDEKSDPSVVASDLLSQAEHDKLASAVLVTDSYAFAQLVRDELERQIPLMDRSDIARASIDDNGKIIITHDIAEAIAISNQIAPEHLEICLDNPFDYLDQIRHAGSVFLGRNCPEALGDYFAGPNHTLPTSGTARFSSPLSGDDFFKKTQFTYFTKDALSGVANKVSIFATKEGLTAHAKSAVIRCGE